MNSRQKRVLIIGLDGFTWRIGDGLIQEDYMPTLGEFRKKGAYGHLKSVIPYETAPAWSSFQTGCLPPKTGVFAFHSVDSEYKNITLNSYDRIQVPSIWEIASAAGKRIISINMPMTSPPPNVNGIIIPGLTCPNLSPKSVFPSDVYEQYIQKYPSYRIVNKEKQDSLDEYVKVAVQTEQVRCDLCLQIMKENDWDLFCVQMQSTDFFQHRNWWALDPSSKGYTKNVYKSAAVFYNKIDDFIKQLTEAAGEDVLVCIVSDHGFCAMKAEFGINTWLSQNGYLSLYPNSDSWTKLKVKVKNASRFVKALSRIYGRIADSIPRKQEDNIKKAGIHAETVMRHIRKIIDLNKTEAFCLCGVTGLLYINPNRPDRANEIVTKLLSEYGPQSSCPLITNILTAAELFNTTENKSVLPSYFILLNDGIANRIQPDGAILIKEDNTESQGGTHDLDGIYLLSGKDVKSINKDASIVDIAPTLLAYMGISVSNDMDGRVLSELLEPSLKATYVDYDMSHDSGCPQNYSDKEQSAVEKQLKDLGYL